MSPLQGEWFEQIIGGSKTVEGRTGHRGKYDDYIGHIVPLRGNRGGSITEPVFVRVVAVRHYLDLDTYVGAEGYQRIAPHNTKAMLKPNEHT